MRWETKLHNQCHCQTDIAENISYVSVEGDGLILCDICCSYLTCSEINTIVLVCVSFSVVVFFTHNDEYREALSIFSPFYLFLSLLLLQV